MAKPKHTAEDADICEALLALATSLKATGKARSKLVAGMLYTIGGAIMDGELDQLLAFHAAYARGYVEARRRADT